MVEKEFLLISNGELVLEAEYFQSKRDQKDPSVLLCHPHPEYGGNMHNNVVSEIFNRLVKNNISCLKFNFRAVGKSTGKHSDGSGELSDVKACINFLLDEKNCKRIILCGYSYGAAIGCSAINYSKNIIGYISISFPWDFMGPEYKNLSQSLKKKLFIQGNQDTIASYENFESHYSFYHSPKKKKIIDGADHFYRGGFEGQISTEVLEFYYSLV
ncbi:MAG TPA: alpha/beta fold hydrolase [bacterium]|nr:alpha/beta fold hydrolase [bacterium]